MTNLDTTTPTGISEHFYKSLSKLNQNEQTQVQRTVFDFLQNPLHPSLKLHRLERSCKELCVRFCVKKGGTS
jgi:hypothetical protein